MGNSQSQPSTRRTSRTLPRSSSSRRTTSSLHRSTSSASSAPRRSISTKAQRSPIVPSSPSSPRPSTSSEKRPVHKSLRSKKKSLELPDLALLSLTEAIPTPVQSEKQDVPRSVSESSEPILASSEPVTPVSEVGSEQGFKTVVKSSIPFPLGLGHGLTPPVVGQETQATPTPQAPSEYAVKISWHGGGENVLLTRAGDDDWKGRTPMHRVPDTPGTFSTTIPLRHGTHHFRFLVDGQVRPADDLPTAVDDQGTLANYVAVGPGIGGVGGGGQGEADVAVEAENDTPQNSAILPPRVHGHSFWNEHDDSEHSAPPSPRIANPPLAPFTAADARSTPASPPSARRPAYVPRWTQDIPLELLEAAAEEEAYLQYQNDVQVQQQNWNQRVHITGFVPLPNIPPAPRLPRYLDKLILNSPVRPPAHPVSPGASSNSSPSPAPSPGIGSGWGPIGERTPREKRGPSSPSRGGERESRRREREWKSMSMSAHMEPGSPDRDRDRRGGRDPRDRREGYDTVRASSSRPLPITTASGTDVSSVVLGSPSGAGSPRGPGSPRGTMSPTRGARDRDRDRDWERIRESSPMDQRAEAGVLDQVIADDTSVLPVPSHVVLHHLCTSAIRNGVLAVGETVRYRKKYVTTVYYKPTS